MAKDAATPPSASPAGCGALGPYPRVICTVHIRQAFIVLTLVADAHPVCSSGDDERKYYKF